MPGQFRLSIQIAAIVLVCVVLRAQSDTDAIISGTAPVRSFRLVPSTTPTPMLRSVAAYTVGTPMRLRTLGWRLPTDSSGIIAVRFALLDSFGNALVGIPDEQFRWSLHLRSADGRRSSFAASPKLRQNIWIEHSLRLVLCLDASSSTRRYRHLICATMDSLGWALGPDDSLAIVLAGTTAIEALPMTHHSELPSLGTFFDRSSDYTGVSRLYYSILWALERYRPSAVIVVTGSDDYASYDVVPVDLIRVAQRSETPIYSVTLGPTVEVAPWEAIGAYTGGKSYPFYSDRDKEAFAHTLIEIVRAEQIASSVSVKIPVEAAADITPGTTLSLECNGDDASYLDSITVLPPSVLLPARQIVALFNNGSSELDSAYRPLLDAIAEVLRANPSQRIELIGHAFGEGTDEAMRSLSVERVLAVKTALSSRGVQPAQLRMKAIGGLKPLYPTPQSPTEYDLDRRVEFRWLDPSLLPYELIVGYAYRERDALHQAEQWEKRGYRAYVEEIMLSGHTAFRVKLWGFATEHDARSSATTIARRYRVNVTIE